MLRAWAVFYIGNFIGGGALVRGAYWFIYLRRLLRLFAKSQLLPAELVEASSVAPMSLPSLEFVSMSCSPSISVTHSGLSI
jgi:hypothetical protein